MRHFFFILFISFSISCGVQLHPTEYVHPDYKAGVFNSVFKSEGILIIDLEEAIPPKSNFIGSLKVSEGIFSEGYVNMIRKIVEEAKLRKANVIKIMSVNPKTVTGLASIESKLYSCSLESLTSDTKVSLQLNDMEKTLISRIQGKRNGKTQSFKVDGYEIVVYDFPKAYDEKHINSIKKEYKIDKAELGWESDKFDEQHIVFKSSITPVEGLPYFTNVYIFPGEQSRTQVFEMGSSLSENKEFEELFISMYLNSKLPSKIFVYSEIDSIYFVNRFITLGPRCHWEDVKNIQCPRLGQLDWDLFSSRERAELFINNRIGVMAGKNGVKQLESETVPVIFEGVPTTAKKYKIKLNMSSFLMGGSNTLYGYYVVQKIDGHYVACVMSHYEDDVVEGQLPPLISEVMQLK